jgi:hypothetical protein
VALDLVADRLFEAVPDLYRQVRRIGLVPEQQVRAISNEFDVFRRQWPDPTRRAMPLTADILRTCAEECWKHGARFALVYIPTRMEVDDGSWRSSVARYGLDPAGWDRARLARALEEFGRQARYPVLDLTPALRDAISLWSGHTYHAHDSHWNAHGHAVAAREVERFLRSLGWLPA